MDQIEKKYKFYNISETHKSFLWTPPKTGSHHNIWVFENLNFECWEMSYDRKEINNLTKQILHNHALNLFDGHEEYQLICGARNPLERFFSAHIYSLFYKERNPDLSKKNFVKQFVINFYERDSPWFQGILFDERTPDYFIRVENLYEDYMKIPFVSESEIAKNGTLKEMCMLKKNSYQQQGLFAKDYYTQDMIDAVYKKYKKYFDLLGYEPKL